MIIVGFKHSSCSSGILTPWLTTTIVDYYWTSAVVYLWIYLRESVSRIASSWPRLHGMPPRAGFIVATALSLLPSSAELVACAAVDDCLLLWWQRRCVAVCVSRCSACRLHESVRRPLHCIRLKKPRWRLSCASLILCSHGTMMWHAAGSAAFNSISASGPAIHCLHSPPRPTLAGGWPCAA